MTVPSWKPEWVETTVVTQARVSRGHLCPQELWRIRWTWLLRASSREGRQRGSQGAGHRPGEQGHANGWLSPGRRQGSGTRRQWDEAAPRALSVVVVNMTDGRQRRSAVRGHDKDFQGSVGKHWRERFQRVNHVAWRRPVFVSLAQHSSLSPTVGLTPRTDLDLDFPGHPPTPPHPSSFWGAVLLVSWGRTSSSSSAACPFGQSSPSPREDMTPSRLGT